MKKDDLIKELKELGFIGYSKYKKEDLIFTLELIKESYEDDCINEILKVKSKGFNVEPMLNNKFNYSQIWEIGSGIIRELNVKLYADSKFDSHQMNQIRYGLIDNLDTSIYADAKYNDRQMYEIRVALRKGVPKSIISKFLNPNIKANKMSFIFNLFNENINIFNLLNEDIVNELSEKDMYSVRFLSNNEKHIKNFLSMNLDQKKEINKVIYENKLDLLSFVDNKFSFRQIREIGYGLIDNLDVSTYANVEFSSSQMEQIRVGLENLVNISIYLDKSIDYKTMKEIRVSIENKKFKRNEFFDFNETENKFVIKDEFKGN
ncbi:MAG: hypothetical protein R3Y64_09255 [Peptostreptococcaceae bacterium]